MIKFVVSISLMIGVFAAEAATTWTFLEHTSLVNKSPGPDGLWLTADDIDDLGGSDGANPFGAASIVVDTAPAVDAYLSGTTPTTGDLIPLPSVLSALPSSDTMVIEGTAGVSPGIFSLIGVGSGDTWSIDSDRSIVYSLPLIGPATGFLILAGEDAASIVGTGELAAHLNFLFSLAPGEVTAAVYFTNIAFSLGSPPPMTHAFLYTTSPIPIPPAIILFAPAIVALRFKRRLSLLLTE